MKRSVKSVIACAALIFPMAAWSAPQSFVNLIGDPGEYITGGNTYFYNTDSGSFTVNYGNTPTWISLRFDTSDGMHYWYAHFRTPVAMTTGTTYDVPLDFPFANTSEPAFDINGDHKGYSPVSGSFTVYDISFANGDLESFAVGFREFGDFSSAGLTGYIWYNSSATPVPEPNTWVLTLAGLILITWKVRLKLSAN